MIMQDWDPRGGGGDRPVHPGRPNPGPVDPYSNTTELYGSPLPLVYGTAWVPGRVIYAPIGRPTDFAPEIYDEPAYPGVGVGALRSRHDLEGADRLLPGPDRGDRVREAGQGRLRQLRDRRRPLELQPALGGVRLVWPWPEPAGGDLPLRADVRPRGRGDGGALVGGGRRGLVAPPLRVRPRGAHALRAPGRRERRPVPDLLRSRARQARELRRPPHPGRVRDHRVRGAAGRHHPGPRDEPEVGEGAHRRRAW